MKTGVGVEGKTCILVPHGIHRNNEIVLRPMKYITHLGSFVNLERKYGDLFDCHERRFFFGGNRGKKRK